ncbi:uncharacterized protein (TIGR04141 family) [Thermobifida halotolerans]|uniref:DUF6119 family protein n=1 Tax=Thermobifida halotolerans TaxID=483545 RepID=UPI0035127BA2
MIAVANQNPAPAQTTKKTPATRKTSLYRLRSTSPPDPEELRDMVLPRYLDRDGFHATPVEHGPVRGFLVTGTTVPGPADWCSALAALSGEPVVEENRTAFGLLLVRTHKAVYALTYGMGHLMIDPARIDPGFGIEFAVRCLDEERITKVRRQVMDARGRTDENSAASGEHIRGFGIEEFGEIVSQIAGKISGVPLTFTRDRTRAAHVTGTDRSVKLHLGSDPSDLLADLRSIEEVCARPNPLPEFEFITQVRPLAPKTEQAQYLDERLDSLLGAGDVSRMALAIPTECRDRFEFAESFKVKLGRRGELLTELDVSFLVDSVKDRTQGKRLHALREGRVEMFADTAAKDRLSRKVPADQWLTVEIPAEAVHYFYWQGRWYEVGAEYLTTIRRRVTELLAQPSTVPLPPWPSGKDETGYNELVAEQDGYVFFDKKNVHTGRLRGGGLEICDVLGPQGQLIHVKKAIKGSAPLNHLFAQARVSMETLRHDTEARSKFIEKIEDLAPGHPVDRSFATPTVVLGILLKDGVPLTVDSLFAFAQVSLLHTATALQGMGAKLEVVSISRDPRT